MSRPGLGLLLLVSLFVSTLSIVDAENFTEVKQARFVDPNTGYLYRVVSYNATLMTTESTHRSFIRVSRIKLNEITRQSIGESEKIQRINFHPTLIDFDIHCKPNHCYLVAVTSRSKRNVELYSWQRTQFDLLAKRDSFARPHSVRLFKIKSGFYIAIAQEQLHLSPFKLNQEDEEPRRFIGCVIFKFTKSQETSLKYHQFIRLPFNPLFVYHFKNYIELRQGPQGKRTENNYLVFSITPNWHEHGDTQAAHFKWSPLNDYFWPHRLPRDASVSSQKGQRYPILKLPTIYQQQPLNLTLKPQQNDSSIEHIEACFSQLQRIITDREMYARKLIDTSRSLWRSNPQIEGMLANRPSGLTNISAQVIVHGNVIVRGSLIESPQITLIGHQRPPQVINVTQLSKVVNDHSPAIVENQLKQATYKLQHVRDKLASAVISNLPVSSNQAQIFNSRIRFFGNIQAQRVLFRGNGIANSNVKLNGIPFNQLEHELVSLNGVQDIGARVIFQGKVVADKLEIHGLINGAYYLKDAVDIMSSRVQVIDGVTYNSNMSSSSFPLIEFNSVSAPEVILSQNATINGARLDDFITKDNKTQFVNGRKSFRQLSMGSLNLAHPHVPLNGFNISSLALNSLRLRDPSGKLYQYINSDHLTFSKSVTVSKLIVNNFINRHINLSSLVHDSVKIFDIGPQQISGHKNFLQGLKIAHLTTEGSINGIPMSQVFNLNPNPPTPDYARYNNSPISGDFVFEGPIDIFGNLNTGSVNGIDITRYAVRRIPLPYDGYNQSYTASPPQIVRGKKIFTKPLRVTNQIRMLDQQQLMTALNNTRVPYSLVNGIDVRLINANIMKQMQNPPLITINNLEIDGNLYLKTSYNRTGPPAATLGNYTICPLDVFQTKTVLAGPADQHIDIPIRVNSLRSRSVYSDPGALNGINFSNDFVLKSSPTNDYRISPPKSGAAQVELVFGHKTFRHLVMAPSASLTADRYDAPRFLNAGNPPRLEQNIVLGAVSSINNITFNELQTFISHERQKNSTGETVLQTLNVHGNIYAKKINGYTWPDDILLKSVGSNIVPAPSPYVHRRIYSPLIFINSSDLEVENQLVLRGPIQLDGRLNGVNLTEFARQSATYGDKDLLSSGRPISNKVFMGGLTVKGEIRSQGLIDGVNFEEMKRRVVVLGPRGTRVHILRPKVFMSDVDFHAPVNMLYLNDLPLDHHLKRVQPQLNGNYIPIRGKKIITGSLKINRNLFVQGLINKIDFVDLKARAISLSGDDNIQFNRTLTIEGDVYMDNLMIDEKDGIIDGVKLTNLIPLETPGNNELFISRPTLNTTQGNNLKLIGSVNECKITCSLSLPPRPTQYNQTQINYSPLPLVSMQRLLQSQPIGRTQQYLPQPPPTTNYANRPVYYNGNVTYMQTTPPYVSTGYYNSPQQVPHLPPSHPLPQPNSRGVVYQDPRKIIQSLALRRPIAIQYEKPQPPKRYIQSGMSPMISQQLDLLRNQIVSLNLIRLSESSDLVIGFIESPSNDISNLDLPELEEPHSSHAIYPKSFLVLDQIDFPFRPTIYHLSVGVATNQKGLNVTSIYSSFGGTHLQQLSVLPIESPNNAKFLTIYDKQTLFLLISQDYTTPAAQCPRYSNSQPTTSLSIDQPNYGLSSGNQVKMGGIHVYLFHALQNSSSLANSYFDLYQTIDLPAIDSFENFEYRGSSYALAISRATNRVYLLILRGYSGFQVVSDIDAPMVESVRLMYARDSRPMLIIFQSNGLHRLMESVII